MKQTHEISTQHLTPAQCDLLKQLVGRRCEIRGTAVIQLLTADIANAETRTWLPKGYGVVCLVKDHRGKQYIFKVYNLVTKEEIHEHRITLKFKYIPKTDWFHYMTGVKDCMTGLNFVDEAEARMFKERVEDKKQKWRFPTIPPHPPGLPECDPPRISIDEIRNYFFPEMQSQAELVKEETNSPELEIKQELVDK